MKNLTYVQYMYCVKDDTVVPGFTRTSTPPGLGDQDTFLVIQGLRVLAAHCLQRNVASMPLT